MFFACVCFLDLAIEIFTKSQKGQAILPLESLCHFALLYNGVTSDNGPPRITKSRTSLRSLRTHWPHTEGTGPSLSSTSSRMVDKQPPVKALEKPLKAELPGPPEGFSLPPSKIVPRNILPMPQIQISIVPSLSTSCPSVKAILRNNQVCSSGNQYIIKHVPTSDRHHTGLSSGDDKAKLNVASSASTLSKDRSYTAWFQQTFGTKFPSGNSNVAGLPLTSSQMVSLHLQSNIPPTLPIFREFAKPLRQLMTRAKPLTENSKVEAVSQSCSESLPEDKRVSHRGS